MISIRTEFLAGTGYAEQFDDFRSRRLPLAALAEGKYDPAFLRR